MKKHKPTTPGRRNMKSTDYRNQTTTSSPEKKLTKSLKKSGGRGSSGRITVRHRGGGHKRRYRDVDFKRTDFGISAKVETIEYDPSRTAFIARVVYENGKRSYILAPQKLAVGEKVQSSKERISLRPGNRMPLKVMPVGTSVYNIELNPGRGGVMVRSAGASAQVLAREGGLVTLQLPSTEIRKVPEDSLATVGRLSNAEKRMENVGKAGRNRWKGKRPTVRGSAMNPVDHPHGGGEGRAPVGLRRSKNKWGKGFRGVKTRKNNKSSDKFIVRRRKKKKKK